LQQAVGPLVTIGSLWQQQQQCMEHLQCSGALVL
jgi:hypothetical protein